MGKVARPVASTRGPGSRMATLAAQDATAQPGIMAIEELQPGQLFIPDVGLLTEATVFCGTDKTLPSAMVAIDWLKSPTPMAMSRLSARKRFKREQRID